MPSKRLLQALDRADHRVLAQRLVGVELGQGADQAAGGAEGRRHRLRQRLAVVLLHVLHDAQHVGRVDHRLAPLAEQREVGRSEEHTSELQSLMRISYAVFCLKKKNITVASAIIPINNTYAP